LYLPVLLDFKSKPVLDSGEKLPLLASSPNRGYALGFLGEVEVAEEAALGGEGVDAGEELLQAGEAVGAFEGGEGFAAALAGVVPALGEGGGFV